MGTTALIILIVLVLIIAFIIINLFRLTLNEFLQKTIMAFLWLWLPLHAFKRLSKEFLERKLK
jgi:hypothetical protein